MAERNQHIIARQILELDVPSLAQAPAVQQSVAQHLRAEGMVQLEALFDTLSDPARVVRLERLEIDLGVLEGAQWREQLQSRLVARLTDALRPLTFDAPAQSSMHGPSTAFEQFLHFLEYGRLPWWGDTPRASWGNELLQKLDDSQWQALAVVLAREERVRERLIHTADDALLSSSVERHTGVREALSVLKASRPVDLPTARHPAWRKQFWLLVLDCATTVGATALGLALGRGLLRLRTSFGAPVAAELEPARVREAWCELPAPWQDWVRAAYSAGDASESSSGPSRDAAATSKVAALASVPATAGVGGIRVEAETVRDVAPGMASDSHRGPSAAKLRPEQNGSTTLVPSNSPRRDTSGSARNHILASVENGIYLGGAGAVVLHPFLEELFRSNALLEGRRFRDEAARARAVHLVTRLTFGDEATPEYELLMPKLLCDMAWEDPLEPLEPTAEERLACEELLSAVLGHWRVLKSSSTQWMREQFFLRPAKLERLEVGWQLTVERRAQDVLLDQLPWGLGVIHLPWRRERIFVHWVK